MPQIDLYPLPIESEPSNRTPHNRSRPIAITHNEMPRFPSTDDTLVDLLQAAMAGSTERTLALLSTAGSTIDINEGPYTPLWVAASEGHSGVVTILLDKGASVSIANDDGATPLHGSAQGGFVGTTKLLTEAGADLDAATFSNGSTPLHMAASRGQSEVMSVLIEAGADINSRRTDGATPLFRAAVAGHVGAVKMLLRAKADPLLIAEDQAEQCCTPLDVAAERGHSGVVRELIQQVGIEGCGGASGGAEALEMAANVEITGMLTAAGVIDTGEALINPARLGRVAAAKILLQQRRGTTRGRRAYVNTRCSNGSETTALMSCVRSASPRIARLLVDAGADTTSKVNAELDEGEVASNVTPLGFTTRLLREKETDKRFRRGVDMGAMERQLNSLKAIRRLLLQVGAVHAISWLWPSNASSTTPAAIAVEGTNRTGPSSTTLTAVLPILRRRAQSPKVLLAALFRWVVVRRWRPSL